MILSSNCSLVVYSLTQTIVPAPNVRMVVTFITQASSCLTYSTENSNGMSLSNSALYSLGYHNTSRFAARANFSSWHLNLDVSTPVISTGGCTSSKAVVRSSIRQQKHAPEALPSLPRRTPTSLLASSPLLLNKSRKQFACRSNSPRLAVLSSLARSTVRAVCTLQFITPLSCPTSPLHGAHAQGGRRP
jgi:hypothetical protein